MSQVIWMAELAQRLGRRPESVKRMILRGDLPPGRTLNGRRFWPREVIERQLGLNLDSPSNDRVRRRAPRGAR